MGARVKVSKIIRPVQISPQSSMLLGDDKHPSGDSPLRAELLEIAFKQDALEEYFHLKLQPRRLSAVGTSAGRTILHALAYQ